MILKSKSSFKNLQKTYLAHEAGDDAMKSGALVAKTLLPSAQCTEVFCKIVTSSR